MQTIDQINKATRTTVDSIKTALSQNISRLAIQELKLDPSKTQILLNIIAASVDEGAQRANRDFLKQVEAALAKFEPVVAVKPSKKK
jgi:DNA-binding SARP family transcriptional activator